ncbi:ectoine/hydroxyectoine ABC transporter permease subunit EhuD [Bradyrhizobium sp. 193]|uniref:ectoine/hydroxyectoine ABC transporter permease subunit EhuD n=1 Tax=Bradyrhizobium sp. 193 TaxID=2782661 RepID=UPI001FF7FC7D|nr:ectoine/hydroxyectoine ABC transporter permease subunit EhuD [Bradyrhizobium sp. 193]MCK1481392.1 ectoine/hydroxyectoine ABC transporter permease subunit EhuD [Bradyrhizobium sp. 193]
MNDFFDFAFAWSILPALLQGAVVTIQATILGYLLAVIVGLPLSLARRSSSLVLVGLSWSVIEFIRSTPLLIQIYVVFFVAPEFGVTLSPMAAGLLSLGLYYGCFIAEVYRAGLDAVPRGQWEAVRALNIGVRQAYQRIILPQAIPPMVPALGNFLIDMFKATPILSVITVLEMMTRAKMIGSETFRYVEPITIVGAIFLILTLISSAIIRRTERYFNNADGRRAAAREDKAGIASEVPTVRTV